MIKTINVSNTETEVELTGGVHVKIKNLGDGTVYVSRSPNVVAENDNVKSIQSGTTDILVDVATYLPEKNDYYGVIYIIADTECKVELETTHNPNFRQIMKGGGDNTDRQINIEYVKKLPENAKQSTIYLVKTGNTYLEYVGSKALGYLEFPETPEIIIQPINCTGNIGDTVIFRVGAIGENLTYQWQYSKDNSNWYKATSDGNTTDTLFITIRNSIFENYYRCVITDTNGNQVISDTVRVHKKE